MQKKFYVTTPIYYATAKPHLGSLYSTVLADVAARWHKIMAYDTFFLTGTDEHGQKIAQAAQAVGMNPKAFVDDFITIYKKIWKQYKIDYNYFIRTTDKEHVIAVQKWIEKLISQGDIYKSIYSGYYCTPCETYITEKDITELLKNNEVPKCISCNRVTSFIEEESYFFKLSAYQDKLLKFYENNPNFITPAQRTNEVINFVSSGLKDLSISRTTITWGIPFPGDEKHVVYVWADALLNYVTAIGYLDKNKESEFSHWWPADLQVIGKDIVRFHAVYWPAFLMASNLPLPKELLVHGWLKVNSQKMSKSLSNVVDPEDFFSDYGCDAVRYYLTRYMPITQDADFSISDLESKINSDLANDLGNLLNRMLALAQKRGLELVEVSNWDDRETELKNSLLEIIELYQADMKAGYFSRALNHVWKYISQVNAYFHENEPWKVKDNDRFIAIIAATGSSLYAIAILLWPVMPDKMEALVKSLGIKLNLDRDLIDHLKNNLFIGKFKIVNIEPLFKKIEPKEVNMSDIAKPEIKEEIIENIAITDFAKVMLVIGTIEDCKEVEKSDKLYKLIVNFGPLGYRQILSGVKASFAIKDLISKQAVFVYNLQPRKMMGLDSNGMLLTAQADDYSLRLITPEFPVPNGTKLK